MNYGGDAADQIVRYSMEGIFRNSVPSMCETEWMRIQHSMR